MLKGTFCGLQRCRDNAGLSSLF